MRFVRLHDRGCWNHGPGCYGALPEERQIQVYFFFRSTPRGHVKTAPGTGREKSERGPETRLGFANVRNGFVSAVKRTRMNLALRPLIST